MESVEDFEREQAAAKEQGRLTFKDPAQGAFIYLEHSEIPVIRVTESSEQVNALIFDSSDGDFIELTVRRSVGDGEVRVFLEEQIRVRRSKIIAYA